MPNNDPNRSLWRFFDGAASVSASMLLAVSINSCAFCRGQFLLGYLNGLTNREDGIIITATLLLFPTAAVLYGGSKMFFAAKEAVERKARERGRREGIAAGRREGVAAGRREGIAAERERISRVLEARGVALSPEVIKDLTGDKE